LQTHYVELVAEAPVLLKNINISEFAALNINSSLKKWNYC